MAQRRRLRSLFAQALPKLAAPARQRWFSGGLASKFETGIPARTADSRSRSPLVLNNNQLESPFPGGKLMVDHLPGYTLSHPSRTMQNWNIVKSVTDPIADKHVPGQLQEPGHDLGSTNLQALEAHAQGDAHAGSKRAKRGGAANRPEHSTFTF